MVADASPDDRANAANSNGLPTIGKPRVLASKRIGIVYFARMENLIKIGYTTNLRLRMRSLQAELLATMPGTMGTEKAMQAKFGPLWVRGELFRPGQELMDYIAGIAT